MRRPSSLGLVVAAFAALPLVALATLRAHAEDAPTTASTPVDLENATCPVKGTPAKATVTETWKGMKVHFCCTHCAAKFKASPDQYVSALRDDPVVAKRMDAVTAGAASAPSIDAAVASWPAPVRAEVVRLAEKYGPPKETAAARIVWEDGEPFARVVVHKDGAAVEQTLRHRLEPAQAERLASFHHVKVDVAKGEVTARHASESLNLVALNLAQDVATGAKTVDQADARWAELEKAVKAGKTPPESQRLAFEPVVGEDATEKGSPQDMPKEDPAGDR
jgi:YHS domain-containing protein